MSGTIFGGSQVIAPAATLIARPVMPGLPGSPVSFANASEQQRGKILPYGSDRSTPLQSPFIMGMPRPADNAVRPNLDTFAGKTLG